MTDHTPVSEDSRPVARPRKRSARQIADRLALDAIYEIAKTFAGAPDPMAVVPQIFNVLSSFLDLRHGVLAVLAEPDGKDKRVNPYRIAATSFRRDPDAPPSDVLPDAVARIVFRSSVPFVAFDLEEEFGPEAVPPRLRDSGQTLIAVPLRDPERSHFVLGVLAAYRSHDHKRAGYSDADVRVLTMVASLLEQALAFRARVARDRERALEDTRRMLQSMTDQRGISQPPVTIDGIIGDSPAISEVVAQVKRVAGTKTPVLLRGESGTGKELFARAVHSQSPRAKGPFIRVNCAALSETLLESELFGHEKGAFTGANALKKGRFELADSGTLFLDEIGEISPTFQTKLLRVLQEGEFERVGGTRTLKVDVRIVAATNRDLEEAVARGEFRADLYFRICVVPIVLPPLRQRKSDIKPLAQLFLDRFNKSNGTNVKFASDAFDQICRCKFPGNVRELENCVNRAAALSDGEIVLANELACSQGACLSAELFRLQEGASPIGGLASGRTITPSVRAPASPPPAYSAPPMAPPPQAAPPMSTPPMAPPVAAPAPEHMVQPAAAAPYEHHPHPEPEEVHQVRRKTSNITRDELIRALESAGWVQAKAARLLGMTPRQIAYALQKFEIELRRI
ncbi:Nif-specific regulatory protein [Rhodobacter aestuarii]|uniref:Nif-specific regulatory protein n=1 Tax=Rhodobacter aestuarii TaxID=453582 RepID=A0A1N7NTB1_9RHOB|nr:nif-specific transcriptional activator NifA [Rhodobacter aestuarii]PTV94566.1 Nif-specific regulatory protein [Rhodobacter aestuarii]SIT01526.1 Nif-specific regulatory protein [Rhodobacter aestuarii]